MNRGRRSRFVQRHCKEIFPWEEYLRFTTSSFSSSRFHSILHTRLHTGDKLQCKYKTTKETDPNAPKKERKQGEKVRQRGSTYGFFQTIFAFHDGTQPSNFL
jgi:hypothetical protein